MKKIKSSCFATCFPILLCLQITAQKLPQRWDEITAADWNNALAKSNKTCILPIGILEKHDFAPSVSGFIDSIFEQMEKDKIELTYGFTEQLSQAGSETLKPIFDRVNQVN